jgi:hypothetical protein
MPGNYHFIDHNALNDRITSTVKTERSAVFRSSVIERDGSVCVVIGNAADLCNAAHIMPKNMGDDVSSIIASCHCPTKSLFSTLV